MRKPEKIKRAMDCCLDKSKRCDDCPYYPISCDTELIKDAREYIQKLELDLQIEKKRTDALAIELLVYKSSKSQKEG